MAAEIRDESDANVPPAFDAPVSPDSPIALQHVGRVDPVVRPFAVSAINARLDRLDRAINQILDILRGMPNAGSRPGRNRQARGG